LQIGLSFDDVRMAVLVQRVVPAHYAFVIHTRNPSNNDEKEIFCELVRGLGEWAASLQSYHLGHVILLL
jgi:alpha-glucan,water dikinase